MDTREKIVNLDELPGLIGKGDWTAVSGLFDPLTLVQAERVAALAGDGRNLLAVVIPEQETLLTVRARAALIAGLRNVDAVVIADPEQVRALGLRVDEDAGAECARSAEFVNFVLQR